MAIYILRTMPKGQGHHRQGTQGCLVTDRHAQEDVTTRCEHLRVHTAWRLHLGVHLTCVLWLQVEEPSEGQSLHLPR